MAPIHLLKGDDPTLVSQAVQALVGDLVGTEDRDLVVDDYDGEDYELAAVVDAAQTPPFLSAKRVVIARGAARFSTAEMVTPLVDYLAEPLPTTSVVLVWQRAGSQTRTAAVPKKLAEAIKSAGGETHETRIPTGRARQAWLSEQAEASGLTLTTGAKRLLGDTLGEDLDRLQGVLAVLESAYGTGAKLDSEDLEPFIGEAGSVPPWDLTDALDGGDIPGALVTLHRLMGAGGRHVLQVLATLQTHYERMLRLDGVNAAGEKAAAEVLGIKGSTFPAKKALEQGRRLGSDGLAAAIGLLARADLDVRGGSGLTPELVMELLVARLARLARR